MNFITKASSNVYRSVGVALVAVLFVGAASFVSAQAAPTFVCHETGGSGYNRLEINGEDLSTHLGHGDFLYEGPSDASKKDADDWCVAHAPTPTDVCLNIDGVQETVPNGYESLSEGQCTLIPVDMCPNIDGTQETVPDGYYVNNDGQCIQNPSEPTNVKVHIYKYVGGTQVPDDSTFPSFPMHASWVTTNFPSGEGDYVLGNSHGGAAFRYAADTSPMTAPVASYNTYEITDGSVVLPIGAECAPDKFRLVGYKSGDSLETAQGATLSDIAPTYTDFSEDKYLIVVNEDCNDVLENACRVEVVSDDTNVVVIEGPDVPAVEILAHPAWSAFIAAASWIWDAKDESGYPVGNGIKTFEKTFFHTGPVNSAILDVASDNGFKVWINGVQVPGSAPEATDEFNYRSDGQNQYDVSGMAFVDGMNTLTVEVNDWGVIGGALYKLVINGETRNLCEQPPVDDTTITVNKVTNVESEQDFNFFLDGSEAAFATLNGGETSGPIVVTPGSHDVWEGVVEGWTLTDITCLNEAQEEVGSIDGPIYLTLEAGDDITCTFTNTQQGEACRAEVVSDDTNVVVIEGPDVPATEVLAHPAWSAFIAGATWIWDAVNPETGYSVGQGIKTFEKTFFHTGPVVSAILDVASDNGFEVWINGVQVPGSAPEATDEFNYSAAGQNQYDVSGMAFVDGMNTLTVRVNDWGVIGGALYKLVINGQTENICEEPTEDGGSITIDKVVAGEGANADLPFDFNLGWLDQDVDASISGNDAPETFSGLTAGSYTIEELTSNEDDWYVTDVTCTTENYSHDPGEGDVEVVLGTNEDVTCTFTNTYLPGSDDGACEVGENLLANGSFEDPIVDGDWEIFAVVANWAISSDGLELWRNFMGGASDGAQNAELDGNATTTVTQTVPTVPGATYKLSFDFSPRPNTTLANNNVDALVDGVVLMNASGDGLALATTTWTEYSQTFVAGDASTDVAFADRGTSDSYGSLIDNAVLCFVSDPQTPGDDDDDTSGDDDDDTSGDDDDDDGGSSGGSRRRSSSSSDGEVLGEVLGEQTSILPIGAPATGFGGLKMCLF